jgi:hypothetical protein
VKPRNVQQIFDDPVDPISTPINGIKHFVARGSDHFLSAKQRLGVTFHNGLTFHYANANTTDAPRRALAIIYMPDGVTYNGHAHVVTDGLGLTVGRPLAGEFFPVLSEG